MIAITTEIGEIIERAACHAGLSRRALAAKAGVAPETVSRMCGRGTGDFATVARLVKAAGLRVGAVGGTARVSRDADAHSLALHGIIAGKVLLHHELIRWRVLPLIRQSRRRHVTPATAELLMVWERAAKAGVGDLVRRCVDPSAAGCELRRVSPLSGVLRPRELQTFEQAFAGP